MVWVVGGGVSHTSTDIVQICLRPHVSLGTSTLSKKDMDPFPSGWSTGDPFILIPGDFVIYSDRLL